jgi:hypothetical protein
MKRQAKQIVIEVRRRSERPDLPSSVHSRAHAEKRAFAGVQPFDRR